MDRMENMVAYGPTFCDITWGAGGSTADLTLDIAKKMQNEVRSHPLHVEMSMLAPVRRCACWQPLSAIPQNCARYAWRR